MSRLGPPSSQEYPPVLTIAGSDSGGGAGIQADLKTFTALGCYGASVVTALTAQNTRGVEDVFPSSPEFIGKQLDSVLSDIAFVAIKTGMLYDGEHVKSVIDGLKRQYTDCGSHIPPLVVDPVCVSTSGHRLLSEQAVSVMIDELFPLATLITPNKSEAEVLLTHYRPQKQNKIDSLDDAIAAASFLAQKTGCSVLLKGGHLKSTRSSLKSTATKYPSVHIDDFEGTMTSSTEILRIHENSSSPRGIVDDEEVGIVVDVLCTSDPRQQEGKTSVLAFSRIDSTSTHGTGCTLSSAIAAFLARGEDLYDAVTSASHYTHRGIETAFAIGHGHGPLNHMHNLTSRLVVLPSVSNPFPLTRLLIHWEIKLWRQFVQHPFVKQLGSGTLPIENFLHFVKQDYHYLKYYARAYGLLVAKSRSFTDMKKYVDTVINVLNEVTMHRAYCARELGISEQELNATIESPATTAYGAYLLECGLNGDETKLVVALSACLLGYGEVGLWLKSEAQKGDTWVTWEGNPYLKWMEDYSGEGYQDAVKAGLAMLEEMARKDPPSKHRLREWTEVWGRCALLEKQFWDMAMNLA